MPDQFSNVRLAKFAREVLVAHILGQPPPHQDNCPSVPHQGLFVTIRTGEKLRGCIGTFKSEEPLAATLHRVIIESAQDSRFAGMPLGPRDLSLLQIDISMLSALQPIDNHGRIEIGRHGIVLEHEHRRGCFLPEVATQYGWDAAKLLSQCCLQKMELPAEAWRDGQARLYVFTVEKIQA